MEMAVIIDVVLAAVLLSCTLAGWRRGAYKSVIGIVIMLVALIGAGLVSSAAAPAVAKVVAPVVSERMEMRVDAYLQEHMPAGAPVEESDAEGLFAAMGLYRDTASNLAQDLMEKVQVGGQAVLQAAAESMSASIARAVLFSLSFVALMVVLTMLSRVLGLLTHVPGVRLINSLGGAGLGLLQGGLVLFALVWVVQFFGGGIPEAVLEETVLFRFFATLNPVEILFSL